jgi:tetratricopeptide (TPR) repeat protein
LRFSHFSAGAGQPCHNTLDPWAPTPRIPQSCASRPCRRWQAIDGGEDEPHLIYGNRAQAYLDSGQAASALSDATRALELSPDGAWLKGRFRMAKALQACGRVDEALQHAEAGFR